MSIVLLAVGGILLGGAWSLGRQGKPRAVVAVVGGLALLALAGGILWMFP